jgi:hypothetical protein
MWRQQPMADRIDTGMDATKSADVDPMLDRVPTRTQPDQLPSCHDSVLGAREPREPHIQMGRVSNLRGLPPCRWRGFSVS